MRAKRGVLQRGSGISPLNTQKIGQNGFIEPTYGGAYMSRRGLSSYADRTMEDVWP